MPASMKNHEEEVVRARVGDLSRYQRNTSYGVTEISYRYDWSHTNKLKTSIATVGIWNVVDLTHRLFTSGRPSSAQDVHLFFDEGTGLEISHGEAVAMRRQNNEACNLDIEGQQLFNNDDFEGALRKFNEAVMKCSNDFSMKASFEQNQANAQRKVESKKKNENKNEIVVNTLNSQGEAEFNAGYFDRAMAIFESAFEKSVDKNIYKANHDKAKNEVDAMNLNKIGDELYRREYFKEALKKYHEANFKSEVERVKSEYKSKEEKTQKIVDKLIVIENYWEDAWNAVIDEESDKKEAKVFFKKVMKVAENASQEFPDVLQFNQYIVYSSLKIEDNQHFNEGFDFQEEGLQMQKQAKNLKVQGRSSETRMKFEEAKQKFLTALKIFNRQIKHDNRFSICVGIVKIQLNEVVLSIQNINEQALNDDLADFNLYNNPSPSHTYSSSNYQRMT